LTITKNEDVPCSSSGFSFYSLPGTSTGLRATSFRRPEDGNKYLIIDGLHPMDQISALCAQVKKHTFLGLILTMWKMPVFRISDRILGLFLQTRRTALSNY